MPVFRPSVTHTLRLLLLATGSFCTPAGAQQERGTTAQAIREVPGRTAHPQSRAQGNPGLSGANALLWPVAAARAQCHQGWGVLLGARVGVTPRRRGRGRPPAAAARGKQSTACLPAPSSLTPTTPATHSYACPMTQTELSRGVDGAPAAQLQSEQPAAWRARHEAPTPAEPCLRQF